MPYEVHECLRSHRVWTSPESCSIWLSPVFDFNRCIWVCRAKFVDRKSLKEVSIFLDYNDVAVLKRQT